MAEKVADAQIVEQVGSIDKTKDVVEVKELKGSEAYNEALLQESVPLTHPRTLQLFACLLIGFFCQTMNGYDTMMFGGLLNNKEYFLKHFNGENKGIWAGLISSMYQIGGVSALPFVGPGIDQWGRRFGMFIGSILIIIGTIIQGMTSHNASEGLMMGGRFVLGFGVTIAAAAGPIWIVETAHPKYRGIITGLCNTTWLAGSILSSGAVRGGLNIKGNNSWLIPVWLQVVFPGLIALFCFFLPESPRWLYAHNKREKAHNVLTKWHGYGNPESVWVRLQLNEYEEFIEMDGSDKRWWDYRALFNKRSSVYRTAVACWFSAFTQWAGNSVLSYFMGAVLDTAGINSSVGKANVQLGYSVEQFCFAVLGAHFVEKIGRRKMMLAGFFGTSLVWIGMTAAAGTLANSLVSGNVGDGDAVFSNENAGNAVLTFIFLFGAVYSFNLTPLQALYPVEVFSFELRAKGMAFQSFFVNAAGLLNQFAWPIAIKKIEWKCYIIFVVWCFIQGCLAYLFFPETRKRTLEELDKIFEAPNPVKFSVQTKTVAITEDNTVVAVDSEKV
ncbi:Lactose permease [Cladophialophora carrionii]|uniref:Lactose permease n=1 Tax=Cladophialophora carrionii TaxID=86049 RepID=A0A1C1CTI7_9EURO|nr:Lactose permease [Cladophialophora carrionii]